MRFLFSVIVVLMFSCNMGEKKAPVAQTTETKDSTESCAPVKDPNNPKPMALMMRLMAANADSIKSEILRGEMPDSTKHPFLRFYMVEPTDPNVLEPQFYENARLFQVAYKEMFRVKKANLSTAYNAMVGKCVNCHEMYCSGPLKRIRKLPIAIN